METTPDENSGSVLPTPEEKPLLSRLLPWVVLLLAAMALFYFLQRGCAGTKGRSVDAAGAMIDSSEQSAKQSGIPAVEEEAREEKKEVKSINLPNGSKVRAGEGSFIAKLMEAFSSGDVSPNTPFTLDNGDFQGKSAILTPQSEKELEQFVTLLKAYPNTKIRIEAHTDNTGNADINMQLSTQQGLAVRSFLQERGITADRLASVGRGQTKPLAPNDSDAGKAQNRRIEIYIVSI